MITTYTHATNIKSITDATLTPHPHGLTSITGTNGAGKTTLTTTVPLLAGWGYTLATNLDGVIREGEKTATATWAFTEGDSAYEVTREFRRSQQGKVTTVRARITIDGQDTATKGLKPSDVTDLVTRVTGLTAREYVATSMIAQGEVAALMSDSPRTVEKEVKRILGLDRARLAADRMRRDLGKKVLPDAPDGETLTRLADLADVRGEELERAEVEYAAAESACREAEVAEREACVRYEGLSEVKRLADEWRASSQRLRSDCEAKQSLTSTAIDRVDSLVAELNSVVDGAVTTPEVWGVDELADTARQAAGLSRDLDESGIIPELQAATRGLADHDPDELAGRLETVRARLVEVEGLRDTADTKVSKARETVDHVVGEHTRAESFLNFLTSAQQQITDSGTCPTCGTNHDSPNEIAGILGERINTAQREVDELSHNVSDAREAHEASRRQLHQQEVEANKARQEVTRVEQLTTRVAEWQATVDGVDSELGDYQKIAQLSGELNSAAKQAVGLFRDYLAAESELTQLGDQPDSVDTDELRDAEENYRDTHGTYTAAANELDATRKAHRVAGNAAQQAADDLKAAQAKHTARMEAESERRDITTAAAALDEFATVYTLEQVGIIEQAVNALLPLVGLDEFDRFNLTNFTPTVEVAGTRRRTSDLSGGEAATLGLLLRIGVVAALNGGALTGTIVADEPLAALDEGARRRVVGVLANLPCPVVVISHTGEAVEEAVKNVEVARVPGGGTEVRG